MQNAAEVREWVMQRVRASRSSGLGDEAKEPASRQGWSSSAVEELRRIRATLQAAP
jgi:hypothetical protein